EQDSRKCQWLRLLGLPTPPRFGALADADRRALLHAVSGLFRTGRTVSFGHRTWGFGGAGHSVLGYRLAGEPGVRWRHADVAGRWPADSAPRPLPCKPDRFAVAGRRRGLDECAELTGGGRRGADRRAGLRHDQSISFSAA